MGSRRTLVRGSPFDLAKHWNLKNWHRKPFILLAYEVKMWELLS
jgi:hypothetical protein